MRYDDDSRRRLEEAGARLEAQHERTEAAIRRLEERLGIEREDEEVVDVLEELWALDLDAYLDRQVPS